MKKTALLGAAVALFAASPAGAGGHVGLTSGRTDTSGSDVDTWQVEGAIGHSAQSFGHAYWKGDSGWRLSGVVAYTDVDQINIEEFSYGVETSIDLGSNVVVAGSGAIGSVDLVASEFDAWNVDAALNIYATPNLRFTVSGGFGNLDNGGLGTTDVDTSSAGVRAEWAPFASTPASLTLGWSHFDDGGLLLDATDALSIGARWNFGGGTLRERDNATPFDARTGFYARVVDMR